jgi:hypothetical protein
MTSTEMNLSSAKSETDILIPLYVDHPDRINNIKFAIKYLKDYGFSNIYVREYYISRSPEYELCELIGDKFSSVFIENFDNFNKMQCVNELAKLSNSKYLAIWDCDVVFPKSNLNEALQMLENGSDVVYPYDGRFYNVLKSDHEILKQGMVNLEHCELCNPNSWGGAVFFKRDVFEEGGRCNPRFKNVGFDDNEIRIRFAKLGYGIDRTSGVLLHLDHHRSETSVEHSQYLNYNMGIYNHIMSLTPEQLKEEIKNW